MSNLFGVRNTLRKCQICVGSPINIVSDRNHIPFLLLNAIFCQLQNVQSAIANQPKVGTGCTSNSIVKEGRVFHGVAVKALSPELEHRNDVLSGLVRNL